MQQHRHPTQRGFALLILLALVGVIVGAAVLTVMAKDSTSKTARTAKTEQALYAAKQALIAYAAGVQLSATGCPKPDLNGYCARPGDLPCPDLDNDGWADPCPNSTSNNSKLIGRLPWRTLGLPDLRDGDGERLWYAVSSKFVDYPRLLATTSPTTVCTVVGQSSCLNSNTTGFITVRDFRANVVNDGTKQATAAVAVIIAPGAILTRLDKTTPQDRSCTGDSNLANCQDTSLVTYHVCTGTGTLPNKVYTGTALCNPVNYLEIARSPVLSVGGTIGNQEDNANFTEGATTNGFISGPITDPSVTGPNPPVKINDIIMPLTFADVMVPVQRRVAQEVLKCLTTYAAANGNRYPWASAISSSNVTIPKCADPSSLRPLTRTSGTPFPIVSQSFYDVTGTYFGHVPDSGADGFACTQNSQPTMSTGWTGSCNINPTSGWWLNWKDLVFYGVAAGYSPAGASACTGTNCLTVSPLPGNKQVVVVVGGPPIAPTGTTQQRPNITSPSCASSPLCGNYVSNYLEGTNATAPGTGAGGWVYQTGSANSTFNDLVVYQ